MPFVSSSFLGAAHFFRPLPLPHLSHHPSTTPKASARSSGADGRNNNSGNRNDDRKDARDNNNPFRPIRRSRRNNNSPPHGSSGLNFAPFDGSRPLLPPWRPDSLEQGFNYAASRIRSREPNYSAAEADCNTEQHSAQSEGFPLVRICHPRDGTTLYAHRVQQTSGRGGGAGGVARVWLRPLLLDGDEGFVDVRGGADLVLDASVGAQEVASELATRVRVNLAATEAEVQARAALDDAFGGLAAQALLEFVRKLGEDDDNGGKE